MLFTSLAFFAFLPLVWAAFVALPAPQRTWLLLAASIVFYGAQRVQLLLPLAAVTLVVVAGVAALRRSRRRGHRRAVLAVALVLVLGALFGLKFYDFAAGEIEAAFGDVVLPRLGVTAPAGFSFYAFSAASVLVDAYAQRLPPAPAARLALYLAWFPKILAGPIERATRFLPRLAAGLVATPARVVIGLQLILWGLVKKVVLADNLAPLVDRAFAIPAFASPVELLLACYLFAFQIYGDFSGYTDIAIGVSLLFGVKLMQNFRRPYLARSTAEFWAQRWHVSLGRWFRDYLYVPLGGSRAGRVRTFVNLMLVFLASGLWHAGLGFGVGWTFLVWGALNGAYGWAGLATRPLWRGLGARLPGVAASRTWAVLRVLLTFHLITLAWVFFRARSLADAVLILRRLAEQAAELPSLLLHYPFGAAHAGAAALVLGLIVLEWLDERRPLLRRLAAAPRWWRWTVWYAAIALLLLAGRWQSQEFIYMQF